MTLFTAVSVTQSDSSWWKALLFAGIVTAVVALIMVLLMGIPVVPALLGLLLGAAPIVGYDLARGAFGSNWRPVIAGVIGNILFVVGIFVPGAAFQVGAPALGILSMIVWPIVVGIMSPNHSVGKLFIASIVGLILAIVVVLAIVAPLFGQDPYGWLGLAGTLFWGVWGGVVGVALSAWSK